MLQLTHNHQFLGECEPSRILKVGRKKPYLVVEYPSKKIRSQRKNMQYLFKCVQSKPQQSDLAIPSISIPGFEKILTSHNWWRKSIWICVLVVFYGLCIFQLVDRLTAYFKFPIGLDVSFEKHKLVSFPSITLCPNFQYGILTTPETWTKMFQRCKRSDIFECRFVEDMNMSLLDVWNYHAINTNLVFSQVSCIKQNASAKCDNYGFIGKRSFPSLFGTCTTWFLKKQLLYQGAQTFFQVHLMLPENYEENKKETAENDDSNKTTHFKTSADNSARNDASQKQSHNGTTSMIAINGSVDVVPSRSITKFDSEYKRSESFEEEYIYQNYHNFPIQNILFMPHGNEILSGHDVFELNHKVRRGLQVDINFRITKMHAMNTLSNPCVQDNTTLSCQENCISKYLDKTAPCRLPFMTRSSLPDCKKLFDINEVSYIIKEAYSEYEGCNCPRPCHETTIDYSYDLYALESNDTIVITLHYPDNKVQVIHEKYTYTISAVVSDVGGSLGFCAGLCLFSFVELLEYFYKIMVNCLNNRKLLKQRMASHRVRKLRKRCNRSY